MADNYESLKLKNQLCFPLYSAANKIIRSYKPLLDKLDLTYTQYITMMVLWEKENINEKELGESLYLKSNTLAPLLKKLQNKGYIEVNKDKVDARNIIISLTNKGRELKEKALEVPNAMHGCIKLSQEDAETLYRLLYKYIEN